ncbi:MAG TPA: polymorphic toxin type 37 domain-containing protein, partial [Burkholderiales bacterium]|nr:polymorphic toxin type 37 domain-containing protein [Burkholderiales bacterium]
SVTDASGQVTTITAYDANGRPLSLTDPHGRVISLSYTPRGWLQSKTVGDKTTRYSYDAAGQLTHVSYADGQTVNYTHDAAHRLTDIADGPGNHIHYMLNAFGKRYNAFFYNARGVAVSGNSHIFDNLLEHVIIKNIPGNGTHPPGLDSDSIKPVCPECLFPILRQISIIRNVENICSKLTSTNDKPAWPGNDASKAPPGTAWRGKPGSQPGDGNGNYYNPITSESYRPDLNHPAPIGPHWDYRAPDGSWSRIFPNGDVIPK